MAYQTGTLNRVAKEAIRNVSTFQAGEIFEHLSEPLADVSYVGLRNWLINVAGLKTNDDNYKKFFEVLDSYIKLTELKNVQNSSEEAKFNLLIAAKTKKDDYKDRRPIFEL
jgi:hypothetical protein